MKKIIITAALLSSFLAGKSQTNFFKEKSLDKPYSATISLDTSFKVHDTVYTVINNTAYREMSFISNFSKHKAFIKYSYDGNQWNIYQFRVGTFNEFSDLSTQRFIYYHP